MNILIKAKKWLGFRGEEGHTDPIVPISEPDMIESRISEIGKGKEPSIVQNSIEVAMRLLRKGMNDQFIADVSGLTLEEVLILKNEKIIKKV